MRTIKELTQEATEIQNACNLSGILLGAHRAAVDLRAVLNGAPCNNHPIMRAWTSKICDMTGNYTGAYPADELRAIMEAPDSDLDVKRSTARAIGA